MDLDATCSDDELTHLVEEMETQEALEASNPNATTLPIIESQEVIDSGHGPGSESDDEAVSPAKKNHKRNIIASQSDEEADCSLDPNFDAEAVTPKKKKSKTNRISSDEENEEKENEVEKRTSPGSSDSAVSSIRSEAHCSKILSDNESGSEAQVTDSSDESYSDCSSNCSTSSSSNSSARSLGSRNHQNEHVLRKLEQLSAQDIDHYASMLQNSGHRKTKSKPKSKNGKLRKTKAAKKGKQKPNPLDDEDDDSVEECRDQRRETGLAEGQEVSIHKIIFSKFDSDDPEEIIMEIMKKQNFNSSGSSKAKYEECDVQDVPEIKENDLPHFVGDNFQIKIYTQEVHRKIGLLRAYGVRQKSTVVHTIIFHYRPRPTEIFALTTGQAWNVVQWCSDFDFSAQIAARILSEGEIETTSKGLVGNEASSKKTMKKHQESNAFSLLELCTTFTAELRDKCSMFRFEAFCAQTHTKMIKAIGSVRIKKRLDTADFLIILSHFSQISNSLPTYLCSTGDEDVRQIEDDTASHLKYLTPVTHDLKRELDIVLSRHILSVIQARNPANLEKLQNYSISHKHYQDFSNASEYNLYYKSRIIKVYYTMPELNTITTDIPYGDLVQSIEGRRGRRVAHRATTEELIEELEKIKLSYKCGGVDKRAEKLLNFIEGPLWHEGGRVYWHVMSLWCAVSNNYLLIVHQQFLTILKEAFVKPDHEAYLNHPWTADVNMEQVELESEISSYVENYGGELGFYRWPAPQNQDVIEVKLFDLMFVNETSDIYIYYMANGLDYKSFNTGGRITSSSLAIQNAYVGAEENTGITNKSRAALQRFYDRNPSFSGVFGISTFKAFLEKLSNARIVYAIGNEVPKLVNESELNTKISTEDIHDILERLEVDVLLANPIHEELISHQYLESSNSITSKFLISTFESFNLGRALIGSILETNRFVFDNIITAYKSNYNSFLLKLDLWRIRKDLPLRSKLFICAIPILPGEDELNDDEQPRKPKRQRRRK